MQTGRIRLVLLPALLSLVAFAGNGCSSLPQVGMPDLTALMSPGKKAPPRQVVSLGKCTVEFRDANGTMEGSTQLDVGSETVVSELLHRSGAFRRYNRVVAHLDRELPNGGQRHQMDIHVDKTKRRPEPHEDYHVRPGDKLVVIEDPRNLLDDMLNHASAGMLGRNPPQMRTKQR